MCHFDGSLSIVNQSVTIASTPRVWRRYRLHLEKYARNPLRRHEIQSRIYSRHSHAKVCLWHGVRSVSAEPVKQESYLHRATKKLNRRYSVQLPLSLPSSKQFLIEGKAMKSLRAIVTATFAAAIVLSSLGMHAQDTNSAPAIQQKLIAEYPLTKASADKSDIVTAGSVLVLEKDNLLMYTTTTTVPPQNTYKNGKISHGVFDAAKKCKFCAYVPGVSSVAAAVPNVDMRTFVSGEKFWVTNIEAHDDGMVFSLLSDPYNDVRYYSTLKFPYPKGAVPPADQMMAMVAEVIKVAPSDDDKGGDNKAAATETAKGGGGAQQGGQAAASSGGQSGQASMAPIPPPPPPADAPPAAPKTIAVGQTKDQVAAIFGQPTRVIKLSSKEIDVYPDMKVTFVHDKVTDVQ
jgi:hypothetical protein